MKNDSLFDTLYLPRDYAFVLDPGSRLGPADLVALAADRAVLLEVHPEIAAWYRKLALALFDALELRHLPQREVVAGAENKEALRRGIGLVEHHDFEDVLGRSWILRQRLLAAPAFGSGTLEGHPFRIDLRFPPGRDEVGRRAAALADPLLAHAREGLRLAGEVDRLIVTLWGCPPERLDAVVTVAQLCERGLELETFDW